MFRHSDATEEDNANQVCPWFLQGYCFKDTACKKKHVRDIACPAYTFGFCMNGPNCSLTQLTSFTLSLFFFVCYCFFFYLWK